MPTLLIPDLRSPHAAMASLPVKLPASLLARLRDQADRLGCSRGALARTLIVRGLEQLEAATAGEVA